MVIVDEPLLMWLALMYWYNRPPYLRFDYLDHRLAIFMMEGV